MTELTLPWPPRELSPNARTHWASDEDDALKSAVDAGLSNKEIAGISGRTERAIQGRAWRLGLLVSREWSKEQIAAVQEMYSHGAVVDIDALCNLTGKSRFAIYIKASRLGLGDPSRPIVQKRKVRTPKFKTPEERSMYMSEVQKALIAKNGHPRRMKGKHHSDSTKETLSDICTAMNLSRTPEQKIEYLVKSMKTKIANGTYAQERPNASWKAGWREIGGINKYYRSKWEANYAKYLEWLKSNKQIKEWKHEPITFWFDGVKRGCVSYLPDFWVQENDGKEAYHEVKGWMDDRSKTKIRRMAKYHPKVKLIVIDSKGYEALKKSVQSLVPGWEL